MKEITYGFGTRLSGVDFGEAIQKVTEALKAEGFGILTEIDVQATLKKKLDVDFRPYKILGACNPSLAKKALEAEPHIGLLLPCNVVVQEIKPGEIEVFIADPKAMFTLVDNDGIQPVAAEADERLKRVIEALQAGTG